ncbi:hypothetical protein Pcinc_018908 [Petrolisthes cinctipes]|uniref:Uncharacterized protein n=1 Tax=Petrolisthes cinctipes TaxID=88211 RepID=A0AAE1FMM4_PETCI|nr:hypothetical protein Pcinc_018908 [Petrolisthes cinctipes]
MSSSSIFFSKPTYQSYVWVEEVEEGGRGGGRRERWRKKRRKKRRRRRGRWKKRKKKGEAEEEDVEGGRDGGKRCGRRERWRIMRRIKRRRRNKRYRGRGGDIRARVVLFGARERLVTLPSLPPSLPWPDCKGQKQATLPEHVPVTPRHLPTLCCQHANFSLHQFWTGGSTGHPNTPD